MKYARFPENLNLWIDAATKSAIMSMASDERRSMSEVARDLIEAGMEARGLIG
jgi:1,2-phenylacetyl-CoA epoxidase PaaB subunit